MAQTMDAAGSNSPPPPRTRKPGEVRSRSGCITCKQRRKKCDENFSIRQNGATSCNRCADRGIHCELSSNVTPQRPSPYPSTSATPASSSKQSSRAVRGPSAASAGHHTDASFTASTSAPPIAPSAPPTGAESTTSSYSSALDSNQAWNTSAHFPMQQLAQHQAQSVAAFPGLQNPAAQLAWMSQNAAGLNRSAVRYNRPNIWPMASSISSHDTASLVGIPNATGNLSAQNNAVDMNTLYNLLNNGSAAGASAPNTAQWSQGYSNSMDNIMLDDFVNELMSLTGPLVGAEGASSLPPTNGNAPGAASHQALTQEARSNYPTGVEQSHAADAQPLDSNLPSSSTAAHTKQTTVPDSASASASGEFPRSGNAKAAAPARASNRYRKLLDSDAIESLLSKYSPIYERFWHATLMLLSNKKRQAAVDYLMSVIRSNKACRASVVVVCLAYHELVQRVRKGAQQSTAKQSTQQAPPPPSWTSVATDAVHNSKVAPTPNSGMSHTILNMFPSEPRDALRHSSQSRAAESSSDEDMPRSRTGDEDDEAPESEEEISIIKHRHSDERPHISTTARVSSERYGSTSFSRGSEKADRTSLAASRNLTGKLSTIKDNIRQMDDPSRDAFKGQRVEEHTVELWFDIAEAELQRSRDELTLDQELCAIINLRWACLCFAGAERARQLTEELGMVMQREGIDMDHAAEEEKKGSFVSVMLLTAVYTDVLDTVSDRGKRTHVKLRDSTDSTLSRPSKLRRASSREGGAGTPSKGEPFFGRISLVSLELLTCFKLISDLSADVWGPISSSVSHPTRPSEEEVAERSREIELKVMSLPPWSDPNTSSSLRVRAFALQEIWRQTARLYLLQAVHRRGPLHPELQNILHEIIRMARMMKIQSFSPTAPVLTGGALSAYRSSSLASSHRSAPPNYIGGLRSSSDPINEIRDANHPDPLINASFGMDDIQTPTSPHAADAESEQEESGPAPFQMWLDVASWEMCTVWFLCSTIALTREDRQFCIHHLESLGLEKANRDNIQVIRDYWAKQDSTGQTLDWFDFVKSTGRSVIFAF